MRCIKCGATAVPSYITNVTDLGDCVIVIRNVPCHKCEQCDEVFYTADVIKRTEDIINDTKKMLQEVAVIDYAKAS